MESMSLDKLAESRSDRGTTRLTTATDSVDGVIRADHLVDLVRVDTKPIKSTSPRQL